MLTTQRRDRRTRRRVSVRSSSAWTIGSCCRPGPGWQRSPTTMLTNMLTTMRPCNTRPMPPTAPWLPRHHGAVGHHRGLRRAGTWGAGVGLGLGTYPRPRPIAPGSGLIPIGRSSVGPESRRRRFPSVAATGGSAGTTSGATPLNPTDPPAHLPGHFITGPDGQPVAVVFGAERSAAASSSTSTTSTTRRPSTRRPPPRAPAGPFHHGPRRAAGRHSSSDSPALTLKATGVTAMSPLVIK